MQIASASGGKYPSLEGADIETVDYIYGGIAVATVQIARSETYLAVIGKGIRCFEDPTAVAVSVPRDACGFECIESVQIACRQCEGVLGCTPVGAKVFIPFLSLFLQTLTS